MEVFNILFRIIIYFFYLFKVTIINEAKGRYYINNFKVILLE